MSCIPLEVITGNDPLYLGITVGTDDDMSSRVELGSVPWAVQALTMTVRTVIVLLCLNRLVAPKPLSGIAEWAAKTVIEELTGVAGPQVLNDDRLAQALDAIYPHLKAIWSEIVSQASEVLPRCGEATPLSLLMVCLNLTR